MKREWVPPGLQGVPQQDSWPWPALRSAESWLARGGLGGKARPQRVQRGLNPFSQAGILPAHADQAGLMVDSWLPC